MTTTTGIKGAAAGAGQATGTVQELASQAKEQVQETAGEVGGKAWERARTQLDTRSTQLGENAAVFGQALRDAAARLQASGQDTGASAAGQAAERVERLSSYLSEAGPDRLLGDIEGFARKRPWVAGGLGVAIGFVAARFLKASSETRYGAVYASGAYQQPQVYQGAAPVRELSLTPRPVPGGYEARGL